MPVLQCEILIFFFRILLDHGADANELYHREYRTGIKQGNSTVSKSRSKRSISTVEHVMRTANEKEKASELIEKLLSNVTNFEEAIELVLDDSSLSFKLLKIILNIAQNLKNSGSVDISDLINRKYRDESMVRNICFFSPLVPSKREKNTLVLLS